MSWIDDLKEGDKVVVENRWSRNIKTVSRTTKTQVIVGKTRYRKNNGYVVGGVSWSNTYIKMATDVLVEQINQEHKKKRPC